MLSNIWILEGVKCLGTIKLEGFNCQCFPSVQLSVERGCFLTENWSWRIISVTISFACWVGFFFTMIGVLHGESFPIYVCCFMGKLSNSALKEYFPYNVCWSHNSINQTQSRTSLSTTSTLAPCKPALFANLPCHTPLISHQQWDESWSTQLCPVSSCAFPSNYNSCYFKSNFSLHATDVACLSSMRSCNHAL